MKYIILTVTTLFILACNVKKDKLSQKSGLINTIENECPPDGVCTFEVFENKVLVINKDNIGALYPTLKDGKKTVLKYEYRRNEIANAQDDNYSEIIYIEIDSEPKSIFLKDNQLTDAKVLFGRLCFCRGQTGYYPVKDGQLTIAKSKKEDTSISLNFKIDEVPQIITSISEKL
ncbi:hypothetical protein [Lacinutrix salivirga]